MRAVLCGRQPLYLHLKSPCKRTQRCWPTTPSIFRCYMLRPFAHLVHVVVCCCVLLVVVAQSLRRSNVIQVQTDGTTPSIVGLKIWELLRSFALSLIHIKLRQQCCLLLRPCCSGEQTDETTCNRACKRTQHVTSYNVGSCGPTINVASVCMGLQ